MRTQVLVAVGAALIVAASAMGRKANGALQPRRQRSSGNDAGFQHTEAVGRSQQPITTRFLIAVAHWRNAE